MNENNNLRVSHYRFLICRSQVRILSGSPQNLSFSAIFYHIYCNFVYFCDSFNRCNYRCSFPRLLRITNSSTVATTVAVVICRPLVAIALTNFWITPTIRTAITRTFFFFSHYICLSAIITSMVIHDKKRRRSSNRRSCRPLSLRPDAKHHLGNSSAACSLRSANICLRSVEALRLLLPRL